MEEILSASPALREFVGKSYAELEVEFPQHGYMTVPGPQGDTKHIWDPSNPDEVEIARRTFELFKEKKYRAFKMNAKNEQGDLVTEFNPDDRRYIFISALGGG